MSYDSGTEAALTAFEDFSAKIRLIRFPLLLLIVLIHARFDGPDYPDCLTRILRTSVLLGKLPHCAVAIFFVISGYLFSWSENANGYIRLMQRKLATLALPYLLWNTFLMLPYLMIAKFPQSSSLLPDSKLAGMNAWQVIVRCYGLNMEAPIDYPLWYLRNLMLLFAIAPAIQWLVRRLPWLLSVAMLMAGTFLTSDCSLWFFSFGIVCRTFDFDARRVEKFWPLCLFLPLGYCILAEFRFFHWAALLWLSIPLFLGVAILLQKLPGIIRKWLSLLGELSFWIYCTHAPVATTFARIGRRVNFLGMPPVAWVAVNIAVTIGMVVLALIVLKSCFPAFARILCGGRVPFKANKAHS
ncbi:MAG: acyltransferase [Victivallales bacterium]|nr:acyltransferase [Victivallales bacterium]